MSFLSPDRLWVLAVPVLLAVGYVAARLLRPRTVVRFTAIDLAEKVMPRGAGWRRAATAVVAIAGLVSIAVAFARPVVAVAVPVEQASLVLAVDVSLSMGARDVAPSRIVAAQDAADRFVAIAPEGIRMGLVAFAGTALPVLPPDTDRGVVRAAIQRLGLAEGTAVGEAIHASLDQLAATADPEAPRAIVVLSDGETTVGRTETDAAAAAVDAGVPVYTISFGTERGFIEYRGEVIPVPVAEGRLADVAEATGGRFFSTADEAELSSILEAIGSEIGVETQDREVTDWAAVIGLGLVALAAAASLRWFGRLV